MTGFEAFLLLDILFDFYCSTLYHLNICRLQSIPWKERFPDNVSPRNVFYQVIMNTKWKIIVLVMLIILCICTIFITLFIVDSRENLKNLVNSEVATMRAIVQTLGEENSRNYRNRIQSFVNCTEFPKQEKVINAFARRDREELLRLSTPYLNIFKQENPYFSTFSWLTPDNYNFLRVHRPTLFGDKIGKMRPDIVAANKEQQQYSGYMVAGTGLQYRLVQPVSYKGQHVGVLQFGLKDSLLLDILHDKLKLPVGMVIPNDKFSFITRSALPSLAVAGSSYTIQSKQLDLFQGNINEIDWKLDQQKVTLQGKTYIIANAFNLLNYRQKVEGYIFVALNISQQEEKLQTRLVFILLLSAAMLMLSFVILYSSYGSLVQKIIVLNQSLEKNNRKLESRVNERTIKLQESEKRLQKILDQAPLGILIADNRTMQLQYANPAICEMLGRSKEELEKMTVASLHTPTDFDHASQEFKAQAEGKKYIATDIPFLRKDGTRFEADVISAPLKLDKKLSVVGFILDRTEKKNMETQLHRAQKMEAIGMMAGGVAHDLNNILSGIVSYPELLLLQLPPSSELRKPIAAIQESGKRAATVVADLLTVARGAASTREPHDINVLIEAYFNSPECRKLQAAHPGIVCTTDLTAKDPIIACSPMHIKKTVMNLLINAVEAIGGDKGTILVSTANRRIEKSATLEHDIAAGYYVVLTVQDTGPGIAPKDLEHIFEPFYTKKVMGQSGTGLGLAIVWNSVQDHQGRIFVESNTKGTRFQLYFPVSKEKEVIQTTNKETEALTGNNEHILVVDDEPHLRDIASQMLRILGYNVDSVCSGELALKFVQETRVDLLVIDMLMEPGMNGRQTYAEILKLYPDQKAIIASGFSESHDVKATIQLGAGGFIKKPYSLEQLGRAVKEVLTN